MNTVVPADRRDATLYEAFAGEISVREAIARRTDSEPPRMVCAWCPDFDPLAPTDGAVTHGICPACDARINAQLDALEASR